MRSVSVGFVFLFLVTACSRKDEAGLFRLVPPSESGVDFRNILEESVDFNIFNYMYFYNGGGVAIGDVNGDSLPDLYFTANQKANALYLNKGNMKFEDITEESGVAGFRGWSSGVAMADVNGDGRLDIYVSNLGDHRIYKGRNQLFINQGNNANGVPIFKDEAMRYGLDLVGFSTQAAFLDYDKDGDLDLFMLNHSLHENGTFGRAELRKRTHPLAGDKLMRNDGGRFVDVTLESGIYSSVIGYGLGVVVSDVNLDGWPDIYVGNDFHENDYLYINQGDGTFREALEGAMKHTSRYTMGVDFADFNNDAFPDLFAADMLPEDPLILKASQAEDAYDVYNFKISYGFGHQFARNTLQLNNHNGTFSDIALLSGVAATDWSWATLFADFDLDGNKDLFVANGISRRSNDLDYINFISADTIQLKMQHKMSDQELAYIAKMPRIKLPNYLFINQGDSTFRNVAEKAGMAQPSYSNGAAYGDLDGDGDLDLVVNNLEDPAFIYENLSIAEGRPSERGYLKFRLDGPGANRFGVGTKIFVYTGGAVQAQECSPTRGYQSTVDYALVFGTGNSAQVDSVLIVWNDDRVQRMYDVPVNQTVLARHTDATENFSYERFHRSIPLFTRVTETVSLPYRHEENRFIEFNREPLIPHMMSTEGPAAAVGDFNGDGREDLFLGGAKWKRGRLFLQTPGGFSESMQPAFAADSTHEDVDAAAFDADGDGDLDLVVVSGGNEFSGKSEYCRPRLYLNDGKGRFTRSEGMPKIYLTGSTVAVGDIDQDGDKDLFIGARTTTWRYGIKPDSYVLLNDGKGNFIDATADIAPELSKFGFVTSSSWVDLDGDGDLDLAIAAEWSPVTVFLNTNGKLSLLELTGTELERSHGWWSTLTPVDFDGDGDVDLVVGNLGTNSRLKASENEPVRMVVGDFDKNDSTDQILTHYINGTEYPFHTRDELTRHLPYLKKRFLSYRKFAEADFKEMFGNVLETRIADFEAFTFESSIVENLGGLQFAIRPLPRAVQFAPVRSILPTDANHDGITDLIVAGNFYPVNIQRGRYDASCGWVLLGNGKGGFEALPPNVSGFMIEGETRKLRTVTVNGEPLILAVRNNDTVELFRNIPKGEPFAIPVKTAATEEKR